MIIHFWELPENRNYILIENKFKDKILKILERKKYVWKFKDRFRNRKISIKKIKNICKNEKISLKHIEKKIIWVGGNNSKGLLNPKFPIDFNNKKGARFIAAIINDGTLTIDGKNSRGRLMYDNFDKTIRESIIKDYLAIFGGNEKEVAFRERENKKYLEFSSVIRDLIELVIKEKGSKCESNIKLPSFILKKKECMMGWIEQTIADEGEVKHFPNRYRRSIVWRRSLDISKIIKKNILKSIGFKKLPLKLQRLIQKQKCNLIESEKKILKALGIKYKIYQLNIYPTTKDKIRTRWQINIAGRENLLKLLKLIKIPSRTKNEKFMKFMKGFVRYKEPLKIRKIVIKLGENNKTFTSIDLKLKMKYKKVNTTYKWLKIFEKQSLIKKIKKSSYGQGKYRKPARYKLILNK